MVVLPFDFRSSGLHRSSERGRRGAPRERPAPRPKARSTDQGAFGSRQRPARFRHLTWTLAVTDFRLRFFGSVLGYLWQLMRPLMLFGVLYVVFSKFFESPSTRFYPVVAVARDRPLRSSPRRPRVGAVGLDRENLVRKIHFPRLAIPLATVLTALFNLGPEPRSRVHLRLARDRARVLARAAGRRRAPTRSRRDRDAALRVVRAVSRRTPDLGRRPADHVLRLADLSCRSSRSTRFPAQTEIILVNPLAALVQQSRHAVIDPSRRAPPRQWGERFGW